MSAIYELRITTAGYSRDCRRNSLSDLWFTRNPYLWNLEPQRCGFAFSVYLYPHLQDNLSVPPQSAKECSHL